MKRHLCLRKPEYSLFRQVAFFRGKAEGEVCPVERMRALIDSPAGRTLYDRRLGTVEPVFGNLRYNKGLDRFTLRGQKKVDTQWQMYCLRVRFLPGSGRLTPNKTDYRQAVQCRLA